MCMVWDMMEKLNPFKFTLPIGTSLSMHDIYIERIAKKNVDGMDEFISLPVASDPIQAWQIGIEDVILTTAKAIHIFRAVEEKENDKDVRKTKLVKSIENYQLGKNSEKKILTIVVLQPIKLPIRTMVH